MGLRPHFFCILLVYYKYFSYVCRVFKHKPMRNITTKELESTLYGFLYWMEEHYCEDMADLDGNYHYAHFMYNNKLCYITISNNVGETYYYDPNPENSPEVDCPGFIEAMLTIGERSWVLYNDDAKWPYHDVDIVSKTMSELA